jgi:acid stress-induced BolA-like protein IbaG/YrbA
MVAIDDMLMQRTSLRGNICRLQRIHVGGDRYHMQLTIVGGNS